MAAMLFFLVTIEVRLYILSAMEIALTSPILNYLPDFRRRVGLIVTGLLTLLDRNIANRRRDLPLWNHIYRAARRFFDLMDRLAAGRWPRQRRGPHTGGAPHPENLRRGNSSPTNPGWLMIVLGWELAGCRAQLEALLAEPAAAEILARVPAAERILRPLRRMLGLRRPRTVGYGDHTSAERLVGGENRGCCRCRLQSRSWRTGASKPMPCSKQLLASTAGFRGAHRCNQLKSQQTSFIPDLCDSRSRLGLVRCLPPVQKTRLRTRTRIAP